MSVRAITDDYRPEVRDAEANFHGNRVVYFHWEEHLMFCAAMAFPLPPDMAWGAVANELLPAHYGKHPDWKSVDLSQTRWTLDGKPFTPRADATLDELGVRHKSLLRFWTPGLHGIGDSKS